ncbi:MAG: type II toxin-antitoxin system VapC family toxin [Alphaproteobacteria bacterium]|nr:type II toxin-antitoxin system VapC family toxin [Alphaproteobacteria bacterium]
MSFLLDTCAISELIKKSPNEGFIRWIVAQEEYHLYLSVLTIGEIIKGIKKLSDNSKQIHLQQWVEQELTTRFQHRLLPINIEICKRWGALLGESEQVGVKIPAIDALIASTAYVHNLKIVTRNVNDFEKCKIEVVNPWA